MVWLLLLTLVLSSLGLLAKRQWCSVYMERKRKKRHGLAIVWGSLISFVFLPIHDENMVL